LAYEGNRNKKGIRLGIQIKKAVTKINATA
jgi:hypothetical protein